MNRAVVFGIGVALFSLLYVVWVTLIAPEIRRMREADRGRCRMRGGPCEFNRRHGHCVSPNGCRDWPPAPRR